MPSVRCFGVPPSNVRRTTGVKIADAAKGETGVDREINTTLSGLSDGEAVVASFYFVKTSCFGRGSLRSGSR